MTPRVVSSVPPTLVEVDAGSGRPLYRQIYESLRQAILQGRLAPGAQLPAARVLAREVGVARQTVVSAVGQLRAEGYLESRERSGIFVSPTLPEKMLRVRPPRPAKPEIGTLAGRTTEWTPAVPFRTGHSAVEAFPWRLWARLTARHARRGGSALAGYGHPAGYGPLRRAIATYITAARGVVCHPDQVVVTCGAQQALDLVARTLITPGAEVGIENPGYLGARQAFAAAGATLVPVPVDSDGLSVAAGMARAPGVRLIYVTPSHQYPLGITMTAPRRLELLSWARRAGAWVVEDDYDSEFRYASRPLASLQGLDGGERVIYIGTFSKTLFPSLRLGYLVLPTNLLDPMLARRFAMDRHTATLEQAALAEFLEDGHFARHVRRMRVLYAERRAALLDALARHAKGAIYPGPADGGMHVMGWLPKGVDDATVAARAAEAGLETPPIAEYWLPSSRRPGYRPGILLGFAGFTPKALKSGVERLTLIVQQMRKGC